MNKLYNIQTDITSGFKKFLSQNIPNRYYLQPKIIETRINKKNSSFIYEKNNVNKWAKFVDNFGRFF